MGITTSRTPPPDTEQKNTADLIMRRAKSMPVKIIPTYQSVQTSGTSFPTGSGSQVSQWTDGEVKRQKQRRGSIVAPTLDDEVKPLLLHTKNKEHASRDLNERFNDVSRPGNEDPRIDTPLKARTAELSGSENKLALDRYNEEQTKKPKRKENMKLPPVETRDAGDIKTAESSENHDASSSNDMNTVKVYERNVKRLEAGVGQLSAEKDGLINRDAVDKKTAESNENHATSSSNDMNRDHEYERNVKRLEARVSQLSAEKDVLLNRLSEIGAMKLTELNPKVTNLGDPNRPEKVVEELSEIYDNEWTDAYEHLTKTRKKNTDLCAKRLLKILQEVFTICMSSTQKKTKALRKAITKYVGLTKEDQDEIDLKEIEIRIREYRRKKMQNNFKGLEEEVGKRLKKILTTETFDDLSEYIGCCVRICWKLCTKEPPMYLDFGDWKEPAQPSNKTATKMYFDKAKFMWYTKSGNYIDYVVWPAVYLFKDGPLMKKGVAQGIQEDEEYKDEPDKPA